MTSLCVAISQIIAVVLCTGCAIHTPDLTVEEVVRQPPFTIETVCYRGWRIANTESADPKLAERNTFDELYGREFGVLVLKATTNVPDLEPRCHMVWIEIPLIHSRYPALLEASETLVWECSCDWRRCSNAKAAKGKVELIVPMEDGGFVATWSVGVNGWSISSATNWEFHAKQPPAEYVDR
jgi:hypothetical protein